MGVRGSILAAARGLPLWVHLLLLALALITPSLMYLGYLVTRFEAEERTRVERRMNRIAHEVSESLDREFVGMHAAVRVLASSPDLAAGDLESFHAHAKAAGGGYQGHVILRDVQGQQLVNTRVPFGTPLPQSAAIGFLSTAFKGQDLHVSDLFKGAVTRRDLVIVSVPAKVEGVTRYYVSLSLFPEQILQLLKQQMLRPGHVITVSDRNGRIVARSSEHDRYVGQTLLPGALEANIGHSGLHRMTASDGTPVLRAYQRSDLSEWIVGATVPTSEIDVVVRERWRTLLSFGVVLAALSLILAYLAARGIAGPIGAVARQAAHLDHLAPQPPLTTRLREVNHVSRALADAARRLELRSRALQESEARLRAMFDRTPVGLLHIDRALSCTYVNPHLLELAQSGAETVLGDRWLEPILPEHRERLTRALRAGLERPVRIEMEVEVDLPKLGSGWIALSALPEVGPDDVVTGFVVAIVDVTQRHNAKQALAQEKLRLEQISLATPDLIYTFDLDQRLITWTNRTVAQMLGIASSTAGEADGRGNAFFELIEPEDRPRLAAHVEAVRRLKEGEIEPMELRMRAADGATRWVLVRSRVFERHADGSPRTLIGLASEITERKQAEQVLERSKEELELRVAQEVARREEGERALARVQRLEALGHLTASVAHDFSNVLQIIDGNIRLHLERYGEAGPRTFLAEALQGVASAVGVVERLKDFGKRQGLMPEVLDLSERVGEAVTWMRPALGPQIVLETRLARELGPVRLDGVGLERALLNLLTNARDAMPEGGRVRITTANLSVAPADATTAAMPGAGNWVCLSIEDDGSGMSPDVLDRAFEPFFTTKSEGSGSGLGLSSVYGFAKQSGGHAVIESAAGTGTTVRLYFPRDEAASSRLPATGERTPTPLRASGTVLLVEDNASLRRMIGMNLATIGYQVVEASDGNHALEMLQSGTAIDVMLSDIAMPGGLSGYDLALWVRAHRPEIGVVLLSGNPEVLKRSIDWGSHRPPIVLSKPVASSRLAAALREEQVARPIKAAE